MIAGVGLDISKISSWQDEEKRLRIIRRFFHPEEADYIRSRGASAAQTAAGIFAAKEAFVKALGTGFGDVVPQDIIVTHAPGGAPEYRAEGTAKAALEARGILACFLSVTHDGGVAAAVCVMERA